MNSDTASPTSVPILETARLQLFEFAPRDAQHLFDLNNDPEVIKYAGDPPFQSVAEAAQFIKDYDHYTLNGFGRWAVYLKDSETFLGWCGLRYEPEVDAVDIGFRFMKMYWNKGFATEAAKACLLYGFNDLHMGRIVGRAMEANTASLRVLEKLGMKRIGTMEFYRHPGVLYELLRPTQIPSESNHQTTA